MNKKTIVTCLFLIVISLVIYSLVGTFALDSTVSIEDTYNFTITGSTGEITLPAGTSKTVLFQITNTNKGIVKYGVAYSGTDISVKYYEDTIDDVTGLLDYGENKFVKLYVENNGTNESTASIKTVLGYENGGSLNVVVPGGYTLVTEVYNVFEELAIHISNLYIDNIKTEVTNNGIVYNYAKEVSLMNDRLGGKTDDYNGGNIRYYGNTPNNYIYFNCNDYSEQSKETCELWRIIGVFDGKVKIMRNSNIGDYSWDNKDQGIGTATDNMGSGSNNWADSRLMMLLNDGYEEGLIASDGDVIYGYEGSLYWNAKSGTCYNGTCNFTSIGLKNDTTRNLISETSWYLRGWDDMAVYSDEIYNYERTTGKVYNSSRAKSWNGKIALPYPSDFGYAADLNSCNVALSSYNDTLCSSTNWMSPIMATSDHAWFLTPKSDSSYVVWKVYISSVVGGAPASNRLGIVPTLYLNSDLTIKKGEGSSSMPYQISVR